MGLVLEAMARRLTVLATRPISLEPLLVAGNAAARATEADLLHATGVPWRIAVSETAGQVKLEIMMPRVRPRRTVLGLDPAAMLRRRLAETLPAARAELAAIVRVRH